jgi:hypothetical protein
MLQDDIFYKLAIVADNDINFVRRCNVFSCSSITCGMVFIGV